MGGWGGYNEHVIMRDERILSSVVKLNTYYLRNAIIMIKDGLLCVMRLVVESLVAYRDELLFWIAHDVKIIFTPSILHIVQVYRILIHYVLIERKYKRAPPHSFSVHIR